MRGETVDQTLEVSLKGGEFRKFMELQFSRIRDQYDLKMVEIDVLYFLAKHREYDTPTDIYRQLKLNRGHISQAIDSLYRKRYIAAIPDENDRRSVHYVTTEKSAAAIADITEVRKALDATIFKGISSNELEIFKHVSMKIRMNLREMLG